MLGGARVPNGMPRFDAYLKPDDVAAIRAYVLRPGRADRGGARELNAGSDPLAPFGAAARRWFTQRFAEPTPVQAQGWARIAAGEHALLVAPTGSGKTLAAFLCVPRPR